MIHYQYLRRAKKLGVDLIETIEDMDYRVLFLGREIAWGETARDAIQSAERWFNRVDDHVDSIEEIHDAPFSNEELLWAFRAGLDLGRHGPKYPKGNPFKSGVHKARREAERKWMERLRMADLPPRRVSKRPSRRSAR